MTKDIEEKAIKYLKDILKALKVKASIEKDDSEEDIVYNIEGEDLGIVIGKDGTTLSSIGFLINIIVNRGEEEYARINIDAEGYNKKKKLKLEQFAVETAGQVEKENEPVTLRPMNPFERRVIHLTLRENTAVQTESHGEDPERYIIVKPL